MKRGRQSGIFRPGGGEGVKERWRRREEREREREEEETVEMAGRMDQARTSDGERKGHRHH